MLVADLNWQRLEAVLAHEDRAVIPLGSTEQHAELSLTTDAILAARVAAEAAEPLGVPVFPTVPYGVTPYFTGYPGTISLRVSTYVALIEDILDNVSRMGFRRILFVNGHGGNAPAASFSAEWMTRNPETRVRVHNWWSAPKTAAFASTIDRVGSHASWSENFPWTRLEELSDSPPPDPTDAAPEVDRDLMASMNPTEVRALLGVGNMGGVPRHSDEAMGALWRVGVEETRASIVGPWGP